MSRYAERANTLIITVDEGVGDEIQFTKYNNGELYIEVAEPWAGDTETGFGATTKTTLTAADLVRLRRWLGW